MSCDIKCTTVNGYHIVISQDKGSLMYNVQVRPVQDAEKHLCGYPVQASCFANLKDAERSYKYFIKTYKEIKS